MPESTFKPTPPVAPPGPTSSREAPTDKQESPEGKRDPNASSGVLTPDQKVDLMSEQTFPASDAPAH